MLASNEQFETVKQFLLQYVSYPQGATIDADLLKYGIEFVVKEGIFTVGEFKRELLRNTNTVCPAEWLPDE